MQDSYREPEARNGPTHGTGLLNHPEPLLMMREVRLQTVLMENCWTMKVPVRRFQSHRLTEREIYGCEVMKESAIIRGCNLSISSATMTMFWMIRMRSRTILIKGETLSVELFGSIDKHCDCYSLGIDLIIIQPCAGAKFCAESFYGIFSKIITFTEWHPNTPRPQGGYPPAQE